MAPASASSALEFDERFDSFDEWMRWWDANHAALPGVVDAVGERVLRQGFVEPITGRRVEAGALDSANRNWREGLLVDGVNSRHRAVLSLLERELRGRSPYDVRIYAPEAVTGPALLLRGRYPKFIGSEYAGSEAAREALYPIPHEDLTALSFKSDCFDLVMTNEVLEHVPDLDAALREIARVLKPGGWHIGTFPFHFMRPVGVVHARLENGTVVHLQPPEYHGNPVDNEGGSLVFEIPGWDVLERTRAAGLRNAAMRFVASEREGHLSEPLGNFVMCAQKVPA